MPPGSRRRSLAFFDAYPTGRGFVVSWFRFPSSDACCATARLVVHFLEQLLEDVLHVVRPERCFRGFPMFSLEVSGAPT